jgi:hypothetical protein
MRLNPKIDKNTVFRLYEKASSHFQSSIFELMDGANETKQTKGLAYLLKSDTPLLWKFLSAPKIQDALKRLQGFDVTVLKTVDYIEIYAEMLAQGNCRLRRDITINFYKGNVMVLFLVIEAKSIRLDAATNIEEQLLQYFDSKHFPDDYSIPHLGITLTKWHEQLTTPKFISIRWLDLIDVLYEHLKVAGGANSLASEYYNFITKADKGMNYYEKEVLSIPAGDTIDCISRYNVHACQRWTPFFGPRNAEIKLGFQALS